MLGNYTDLCLRDYANVPDGEEALCVPPLSALSFFFEYNTRTAQFGDWIDADGTEERAVRRGINRMNEVGCVCSCTDDPMWMDVGSLSCRVLSRQGL